MSAAYLDLEEIGVEVSRISGMIEIASVATATQDSVPPFEGLPHIAGDRLVGVAEAIDRLVYMLKGI